ncbi:BREX system ATP-binding protein BrxD [Thermobifida fusca]|uniref:ATP/GTP binding protein n=2 Tax=Thermobifida fusca TaxID=2021 RepID=A0A9P2TC50_THEFU|nr:BREX system ATP-binding protein BrxD [Thermobifida fusca]AAZ54749.1 putative ATP/GTP binding protein [Thermobifida fusca YX]EOR72260.1 ATP/GTP binding protein [Thermobifida fusca TM51]QOS60269.1 BREX system ATP-binding protein BrxD [Thermobifida fusca]
MKTVSAARRREVLDALRRGTVPQNGLDLFAVGLDRYETVLDEELAAVGAGSASFKAVRGEYGSGKTFFSRWLAERAKRAGFAVTEIQISETETPLHRLETVYRRLTERLATATQPPSALREIVDNWVYTLEEDVLDHGTVPSGDEHALTQAVAELLEQRLAGVARSSPAVALALRGYHRAQAEGQHAIADALVAWLGGQPNVAAAAKRYAGIKGDLDHSGALAALQGLLTLLRDCGHPGLLIVLDELETLQRARSDTRDKALNALRQLIDEITAGRFPGLYLVITGTPAFYDGPQGVQRLAPLAQRLATDFMPDPRHDNLRAVQIRLPSFDLDRLHQLGTTVRDLYANGAEAPDRIRARVDNTYIRDLAQAVAGELGGRVGVAPRLFLRKLVDVIDRVNDIPDFDPRIHYQLTVRASDLTETERNTWTPRAASADEVELSL